MHTASYALYPHRDSILAVVFSALEDNNVTIRVVAIATISRLLQLGGFLSNEKVMLLIEGWVLSFCSNNNDYQYHKSWCGHFISTTGPAITLGGLAAAMIVTSLSIRWGCVRSTWCEWLSQTPTPLSGESAIVHIVVGRRGALYLDTHCFSVLHCSRAESASALGVMGRWYSQVVVEEILPQLVEGLTG